MDCKYEKTAFYPADILLPDKCDMSKWSTVACDQYTSQPEYWRNVESIVGESPSALKLMLPEMYLNTDNVSDRIHKINEAMQRSISKGIFREIPQSFVYVERTLKNGCVRRGLVGAVDLEAYDYTPGSGSLIRATEGTVPSRIPPRVAVREGAPLEMPHVMLLVDDPAFTVIEPFKKKKEALEKLYDFELMKGGGHITGHRVRGTGVCAVENALAALSAPLAFRQKYGIKDKPVLLFAVGDGNHSLATAKVCWEKIKAGLSPQSAATHPARYALVELVNIHDPSLEFEPIHRVVFDVNTADLLRSLFQFFPGTVEGHRDGQYIGYACAGRSGGFTVTHPTGGIAAGTLQNFLDDYLRKNGGRVDYIHGTTVAVGLAAQPGDIAFLLPSVGKSELFRTVITDGVLPRKTFSMGEADDKRFYLECRRIQ